MTAQEFAQYYLCRSNELLPNYKMLSQHGFRNEGFRTFDRHCYMRYAILTCCNESFGYSDSSNPPSDLFQLIAYNCSRTGLAIHGSMISYFSIHSSTKQQGSIHNFLYRLALRKFYIDHAAIISCHVAEVIGCWRL